MSQTIVIADASCLITLGNIGEIEILPKLFEKINITPEVASEVGSALPIWIRVRSSSDPDRIRQLKESLDTGEATSIALALETTDSLLIIDEKKGRRTALALGLRIIGTLGVVLRANESGYIDSPASIAERLERVGFRLSPDLRKELSGMIH